ncbi:lipopolysaccharide biosynthesis protein [Gloeocapsa sp. PCC 73106]|uniref:lipopolysaccharide biosynthesis protein n=1 Tax=Gloeocapsa sp. PCC 73106 TaxID=102232 RepID=UPI0002AC5ACE|nr:lipopolysaccharide biosynthesis protein [Gloeocapsa sp. PCC 73106]ELR96306.1 membrane protein involved in the export of O-antigen and teichoic acid [Gloeocapsa sp. PCC 73106]
MQDPPKTKNLTSRSLDAVLWLISGTGLKILIQLVQTIILARLLTPKDFGLMGAALIVVRFVEQYPIGIAPALIQLPDLESRHLRTGFTLSVIFGLLIGALLWLLAPLFANFVANEQTVPILRFIALTFPVRSLGTVAEALMERELKFRWLSSIQVFSHVIGYGLVGITLALLNFGVWSLVLAYTIQMLLRSLLPLLLQPYPKLLQLEPKTTRELVNLSGGFTLSNLIEYFALQGDYIIVSRGLGLEALGLYTKAYHLMNLPAATMGQALNRVLFATLAKVQADKERLIRAYRRNIVVVALTILPLSLVMSILAPEIILVLLGPQWTEVIIPFQILALGTFFRFGDKVTSSLARSSGQMYRMAWFKLIYAILIAIGAIWGLSYGIPGVTVGVTIALVIQYLLLTRLAMSLTEIDAKSVIISHVCALPLTIATGLSVWVNATLWRSLGLANIFVLLLSLSLTGSLVLLLIYINPNLFLGQDGKWWLKTIAQSLTSSSLWKKFKGKKR